MGILNAFFFHHFVEGLKEKRVVARGVVAQLEQFDTLHSLAETQRG